jgi:hypothetical protein
MIIDTYVYFVSYQWWIPNVNNDLITNMEYHCETKIKTVQEIRDMQDTILENLKKDNPKDKVYAVRILNFQLLDSYNKEEREARDSER